MKLINVLTLAATLVSASPIASPAEVEVRQLGSSTRNDLVNGNSNNCPKAILIFARGSTEGGNMGGTVGPALAGALESKFRNNIWIQGVGSPYNADLGTNALPKGTNQASIDEAKRLFNMAQTKCPQSQVVTGGYSQGTAVVGNALTEASAAVKNQVVGAALFGYTKNLQNLGRIKDFPTSKTKVYCQTGDLVCTGTLVITAAHFLYNDDARGPAARFLEDQINRA